MRHVLLIAAIAAGCKGADKTDDTTKRVEPAAPPASGSSTTSTPDTAGTTGTTMTPPPETPATDRGQLTELVRGSNRFALALWSRAGTGTIAMSPASISAALTITWGGAKGETAAQLQKTLGLSGSADAVLSQWGNLYKSLQSPSLKLANRLYGEKSFNIDTTYFTIIRKAFEVWVEPVDFVGDAEGTRTKINSWVAEQTEQRIKDLLPPRSVDRDTRIVIVNAIYFLADWARPFDASRTQPRDFYADGKTVRPVPMMTQTSRFSYAHQAGASLVELPYQDKKTAMYIVLPDARDGLPALESKLEPTLKALQSAAAETSVALSLPRFTIDPAQTIDLAKQLQALGIVDAFSAEKADFTGIAKPNAAGEPLFISAVFHKAFVKVDEKGTEAAAATAVAMPRGGPPPKPTELVADHPFLFLIVDKPSGLILFIGRVTDPRS
jgi:serpin B